MSCSLFCGDICCCTACEVVRRLGPGRRPVEFPAVLDEVDRVCARCEVEDALDRDFWDPFVLGLASWG